MHWETRTSGTYLESKFIDSSRQDHISIYAFEADYRASMRWVWLGGLSYSKRISNQAQRGYDDTTVYLGIKYTR